MATKITHLVLIEDNDPIGMEEIMKRVAGALSGDVIQLVPVIVPKPTPPIVIPPVKWVRLKNAANTINIRSTPEVVLGNILGKVTGKDKYSLLSENNGNWYEISYMQKSGWVSKKYMVIV